MAAIVSARAVTAMTAALMASLFLEVSRAISQSIAAIICSSLEAPGSRNGAGKNCTVPVERSDFVDGIQHLYER